MMEGGSERRRVGMQRKCKRRCLGGTARFDPDHDFGVSISRSLKDKRVAR